MKIQKLKALGSTLVIASLSIMPSSNADSGLSSIATQIASRATLGINSWPPGISVTNTTCYTVPSGVCGTTPWTSFSNEGIPVTTYTFPPTVNIDGIDYVLDPAAITGCNANGANPAPGVCSTSVAVGELHSIFATYKDLPSPAIPNCFLSAQNLVANHGFESTFGSGGLSHTWPVAPQNQTKVQHWFSFGNTASGAATNSTTYGGNPPGAFEGSKFMVMGFAGGLANPKIQAEIVHPTVGANYVVTARVRANAGPHPDFIYFNFQNSGNQNRSAILTRVVHNSNTGWDLVGGVITANAYFNRLVIQMSGETISAAIDDVKVCKLATEKKIAQSPTPTPVPSSSFSLAPAKPPVAPVVTPTPTLTPTQSSAMSPTGPAGGAAGPSKP